MSKNLPQEGSALKGASIGTATARAEPFWKEVVRWMAVLPGATLGAAACFWVTKAAMMLKSSSSGNDSWLFLILYQMITSSALGYAFVYCGARIAPRAKSAVAVALAAIFVLYYAGIVALFLRGLHLNGLSVAEAFRTNVRDSWMLVLEVVCSICSAVASAYEVVGANRKAVDVV